MSLAERRRSHPYLNWIQYVKYVLARMFDRGFYWIIFHVLTYMVRPEFCLI